MQESIPLQSVEPGRPFFLAALGLLVLLLGIRWILRRGSASHYDRIAEAIERWTLLAVIVGMIGFSIFQIILRNFFQSGVLWIDPLLRSMVLWLAFLGSVAATARGRHIAIDVLSRILPRKGRRSLARVLALVSAAACLVLANGAWEFLRLEMEFPSEAFAGIQTWKVQSIVLLGFLMLAYRFSVVVAEGPPPEQEQEADRESEQESEQEQEQEPEQDQEQDQARQQEQKPEQDQEQEEDGDPPDGNRDRGGGR